MDDPRNALLDPQQDSLEVQAIRREMEDIRRAIETLEKSVQARLRQERSSEEGAEPDEDSMLDDYNQYKAAEAHIEARIVAVERRVAELEDRYGVNVLLN